MQLYHMRLFIWSALLEAYDRLSQLASDDALKSFLSVIHDNYDKVSNLCTDLCSYYAITIVTSCC